MDQEVKKIATIISNYFDGAVAEVDIDTVAMQISEAGLHLCGDENCQNFKHYEAECTRCTEAMKIKQQLQGGDTTGGKTIAEWAKVVHENAKAHGWWDNPRREGELLMLIISEVSEAFEEVRNGHGMNETYYSAGGKMEGVPSELADVVIRIMDLCEYYGIDIEAAIAEKHAFNLTRPFKHGGKKL